MIHSDDWKKIGTLPEGKAVYYNVKTKAKAKEEDHRYLVEISGEEMQSAELFIDDESECTAEPVFAVDLTIGIDLCKNSFRNGRLISKIQHHCRGNRLGV